MSLEIKAYKEITAYQAKVLFGMSWRQLLVAGIGLLVLPALYAVAWWAGSEDLGTYAIAIAAMPLFAIGWIRPKGLPFEKYIGYVVSHHLGEKRFLYRQVPQFSCEVESRYDEEATKQTRPRGKRQRFNEVTQA